MKNALLLKAIARFFAFTPRCAVAIVVSETIVTGPPRRLCLLFNRQNGIAAAVLLISGVAYWRLATHSEYDVFSPDGLQQAIASLGQSSILVYIGLIALSVVLSPLPGAPLTVAAGAVWGAIPAATYSVMGGFLGGVVAYFIGRSLGRSTVLALTGKVVYFTKDRGEVYLGWLIFISRLLPVLSFDLISYASGLTGLSFPIYAIATLLGMIPSTLFLTYMGATFTINMTLGIALSIVFWLIFIGVPWGIHRYNWFGMRDIIRID